MIATIPDASLDVYSLGLVDYDSALALQQRLVYESTGRTDRHGWLLLCEHPPLLTVGREGSRSHLRFEPQDLAALELDVRWMNRGGGCLIHCPGQLAIYPVLPLQKMDLGLAEYRQSLLEGLQLACSATRVTPWIDQASSGIWCRTGQVAFVGAAVKSWTSYHGAFLNVDPDLNWFRWVQVNPQHRRATSLRAERQRPVSMSLVRESLARHLAAAWGFKRYDFHTGHPWLRRTTRTCLTSWSRSNG